MGNRKENILVTGGAGYIGSTVCSALGDAGYQPIILDNLALGPKAFTKGRIFYEGDIADRSLLEKIFREQGVPFATIHCAALIVVPESVTHPDRYYEENVTKSLKLFCNLRDLGCSRVVFSSSAAIYDGSKGGLVAETSPTLPASPYANTKMIMESILKDFCHAYSLSSIVLRYFNPIGADPEMRSGPYLPAPTHVLGKLVSTARGQNPIFEITGTDWPTRDGTGIRDYIHVWDLARAHVAAVQNFHQALEGEKYRIFNLGTGRGVTVKELVRAFEEVIKRELPKRNAPSRPGDTMGSYASCELAAKHLKWKAERSIAQGIADALKWAEIWGQNKG